MTTYEVTVDVTASVPAGNNGEVQYKNGTVFGAAANVEIESGFLNLMPGGNPGAPAAGIKLAMEEVAGKPFLKHIGTRGGLQCQQPDISDKKIFILNPDISGATNPTAIGPAINVVGTPSYVPSAPSAGSYLPGVSRKRFTSGVGANAQAGLRNNVSPWFRGDNVSKGGFFFRAAFQQAQNTAGTAAFVGLSSYNNDLNVNPSTMPHFCGVGFDTTDVAGNWFIMTRGNAAVNKIDLGALMQRANFTELYELVMYMAPSGSELFVRVTNLSTGVLVYDGSVTTNLPGVNTGMQAFCEIQNGATASAIAIDIARMYVESNI